MTNTTTAARRRPSSTTEPDKVHAPPSHAPSSTESSSPADPAQACATDHTPEEIEARAAQLREYLFASQELWVSVDKKLDTLEKVKAAIPASCDRPEVLYRFALVRHFDMESAAKRFLRFCGAVAEAGCGDVPLGKMPAAAEPVVKTGCWHVLDAVDKLGRPVLNVYAEHVDWSKHDVAAMKAACMYYCWKASTLHGFAAQEVGVACGLYMRELSSSMICSEYCSFAFRLLQQALPMRIGAAFVDATYFTSNMMWSAMRVGVSTKLQHRVVWLKDKPDTKKGHTRAYQELHDTQPASMIPHYMGGDLTFDPAVEFVKLVSEG